MASDDVAISSDKNRVHKSEGTNAASNFGDLRLAVGSRVSSRRDQPTDRPDFNVQGFGQARFLLFHLRPNADARPLPPPRDKKVSEFCGYPRVPATRSPGPNAQRFN